MFVDFDNYGPPPRPWDPNPRIRLTKRQERTVAWIVGANLLLLLVAPLGGSTLVEAAIILFRH